MCTGITVKTSDGTVLMGRTMDFSLELDPQLYFFPRRYVWNNILNTVRIRTQYSFMGVGQDISPITFADGVNEMGFSAAVLYFPGYADYDQEDIECNTLPIAAIEMVKLLLSLCANVQNAASVLQKISIVGVKDAVTNSIAPLHWLIADQSGNCGVIEKTKNGLQLMNNPMGVLSNSPDFQWHMTNLRNYMNVQPAQQEEQLWDTVKLTPLGQGAGTFGLPGDYTPPSRFVRAAYLKSHTRFPKDREEAVTACFHVMESVSIPKDVVITKGGTSDYTQYTAFMNLSSLEYFYKTYNNSEIIRVKMPAEHKCGSEIISLGRLNRPISFGCVKTPYE